MSFIQCAELLLAGADEEAVELLVRLSPVMGAKARDALTERRRREAEVLDLRLRLGRTPSEADEQVFRAVPDPTSPAPRDLTSCVLAAELGDVRAALEASELFEAAGDRPRAEQVLRDALDGTRFDERLDRVEARLHLARLLDEHDPTAAGVEFRRCEELEGSTEAAWEAARWCVRNDRREEGRYRWRVLAETGLRDMRSEAAYLDSEWKAYRNQWQKSATTVSCWSDAMRRQMLLGIVEDRPLDVRRYLAGVSESYRWTPDVEDLLAHTYLAATLESLGRVPAKRRDAAPAGSVTDVADEVSGPAALDWLLTVLLPTILDLAGDTGNAEIFARLDNIGTEDGVGAACEAIEGLCGSRSEGKDLAYAVTSGENDGDRWAPGAEYWVGTAERAYDHLTTELGIAGTPGRLLAGTRMWVKMAIDVTDTRNWTSVWDDTSRAVAYSVGLLVGPVRRGYAERGTASIDPGAVSRALDEVIPNLRSGLFRGLTAQ